MKKETVLIKTLMGLAAVTLLCGCPIIDTLLTNPRALDPRYNYSKNDLDKYNSWVEITLQESAQNGSNSIIVNKSAYKLFLIKEGKVDTVYRVDLGFNPFDDKQIEGDGCTPEGMYIVQRKLEIGQTAFHRAFLIDYPNNEDKLLGKTGGLIEIHGSGTGMTKLQGGYNWTWGCVALSDEDMDSIFSQINEADRITIVKYLDLFLSD